VPLPSSHPSFEAQLDAYLDGELAATDARELEAHLAQCADCTRFRDGRVALRAAIAAEVPVFQTSDVLRQRVRTALRTSARKSRFNLQAWWRPLALAASFVIVALGGWNLALQRAAGAALADDVLSSHIRSLMPGHLTDVVSSDQHTVKPWFNGKLDYSPPVHDFAVQGFPIIWMDARSPCSRTAGASTSSTCSSGLGRAARAARPTFATARAITCGTGLRRTTPTGSCRTWGAQS